MSELARWHEDLKQLAIFDAEGWRLVHHSHERRILGREDLAPALAGLGAVSGWLLETGRVVEVHDSEVNLRGLLLEAECFAGDEHWLLRHDHGDRWFMDVHSVRPCTADTANALAEPVVQLRRGGGVLHYLRLWTPDVDDGGAPVCRVALLDGMDGDRS